MKHNCKVIPLAALVVCLFVGTLVAGCGGPSVAGAYSASYYPEFRLDLKSNGTYLHTVNDLEAKWSEGPWPEEVTVKTYQGTYTVNDKRVVLNGEPDEAKSFKIVGRNLSGAYGLWVRQPAAKK